MGRAAVGGLSLELTPVGGDLAPAGPSLSLSEIKTLNKQELDNVIFR
jgi:hypothetical protein